MTLTAKQQAQVAKAPPAQKAAMRAMFNSQNSGTMNKQRSQAQRAQPRRGPARRALGSVPKSLSYAFDAFDKRHMPLDERTAPYTTTSFINVMQFSTSPDMDQVVLIAPRTQGQQEAYNGPLTDYIAMRYDANETIGASIPTLQTMRSPILGSIAPTATIQRFSIRGRLHNLSARLQCLGTNTGLYPPGVAYVGSVPTLEVGAYSSQTGITIQEAWANDSIEVGYLKPVAAASLVEKPVTLHAGIAENTSYKSWHDFCIPGTGHDVGSTSITTALTPIVIYIPRCGAGSTAVDYKVEVAQQWCTRHPFDVMMRSTQKQHTASLPSEWQKAVNAVKDIGGHLVERAGNTALDVLATRLRQAYMNPTNAIQYVD